MATKADEVHIEDDYDDDNDNHQQPRRKRVRLSPAERLLQYKPGSIRRVKLENFLTYSEVEFTPGPRLNVVMGPNGTGKSTILCALCLGLGGSPKLLGRADDARTFIMHHQDVATIEIELAPHHDTNQTHILKRTIDRNLGSERGRGIAASKYYINANPCSLKDIQSLVKDTYHISIDNLCTFLPQDKVGSFSGFNPKELLIETQKSVSGTQSLHEEHLTLISLEKELLSSGSNNQSLKDKLKRLQDDNERLEREKELMKEREEHLKHKRLLEQKLAWCEFDMMRDKAVTIQGKKKKLKQDLTEVMRGLQPLEDSIQRYEHEGRAMQGRSKSTAQGLDKCHKKYEDCCTRAEKCYDLIDTDMGDLNDLDSSVRRAQEEVRIKRGQLEEEERVLGDWPPEEELQEKCRTANEEMRESKKLMNPAKREAEKLYYTMREKQKHLDHENQKLAKMQDDKARRNERIYQNDQNLAKTSNWVNQNRKMFRRPVWGPIVCEVTTTTIESASYLEHHVPNAVLKTFVVECREDYNLLYREVRQKLGLPINIQTVSHGRLQPINRMYSEERMNLLKANHGVLGYLDELFEAPDAILQALRDRAGVGGVLVGDEGTTESLNREKLLDFLAEREDGGKKRGVTVIAKDGAKSYRYTSRVSRYGGESFVTVDEIGRGRLLIPGVLPEQKEALERQILTLEEEIKNFEPEVKAANEKHQFYLQTGQEASTVFKDAQKAMRELTGQKRKIALAKRRLENAEEAASKDNVAEKKIFMDKIKGNLDRQITFLETAAEMHDEYMKLDKVLTIMKVAEDGVQAKVTTLREKLHECQRRSKGLEKDFKEVSQQFDQIKRQLKMKKERAEQIAPLTDEEGNELPLKEKLNELPSDEMELREAIDSANERANAIHDNPDVLHRYEEQKREIEDLEEQLERLNDSEQAKRNEIENTRKNWETSLNGLVQKVNILFGGYMKEFGCAGEIQIARGEENEENLGNFEEWGIEIQVKFREKSKLQVLSAQVHSGGERSVSTILYLMALQDLMVSPFRCVDEINQGLDDRNERLVFRRIVENSTKLPKNQDVPYSHCGQYFLITPKLLPNLTDMEHEDVTVLCIFNGPFNFGHFSDWNVDNFLQSKKRFASPGGDDDDDEESQGDEGNERSHRKKRKVK